MWCCVYDCEYIGEYVGISKSSHEHMTDRSGKSFAGVLLFLHGCLAVTVQIGKLTFGSVRCAS